jgi:hypothetical protein
MHLAIEFLFYWSLAFVSLCIALLLLNIFDSIIDGDMELHSLGKEMAIAGFASLIEGAGLWVVVMMIAAPYRAMGLRAMIIPFLIVMLFYKVAHLEDWSIFDAIFLLFFQLFICCLIGTLTSGHFEAAMLMTVTFVFILAIVAGYAKSL